ncbi:nSTAND1 domain-containing NTPase [Kutzneria chonburiensis]|uniref:Novel STAND NTPase 1 domain-containing protein n=1 Tax=Kutzneria chonburiensis TaxID=1483604 RepID=A0ABV6MQ00_9PSEU|nr:hypothetical protein [Kutzneria chonburiensis]
MGMPRAERPLENGPLREFAAGMRQLRIDAGSPPYRELAVRAGYSPSVLSDAANGRKLPTLAVTLAYVTACRGDIAEWEARWRALTEPVVVEDGPCPYVGLSAFQADDAELFFGRERLVDQVLELLRNRRFVGVFGASGAGKSSLLRAGVAAAGVWNALVVTPGARPFEELAARLSTSVEELAEHPSNLALVLRQQGVELLVVDQFEELFTLCPDEDRATFVAALMHPALRVLIGVRADFYGHCGQFPTLVAALDGGQVLVGPMTADELRRAIIRPAAVADCVVEEALVTRLVADVGNQVGALPLLSHALRETWHRRQGISLTLGAYEKTGGLQHALAQSAEQTFNALTPSQQVRARQLFLRLVALGDGTEDTRRRVPAAELDPAMPLAELVAARLVTQDRHGVEITHEALIRHWPRLAGWLADDRDGLRVHRQLTQAAEVWVSLDRDDEALYVGNRLARAQEWADDNDTALSVREADFLRASQSLDRATTAAARRGARRLRALAIALAVLFVLSTGTAALAVQAVLARQTTESQRDAAVVDSVALKIPGLENSGNPSLAGKVALALQMLAPRTNPGVLANALVRRELLTGATTGAGFSQSAKRLVTTNADGTIQVWDLTGHEPTLIASRQESVPPVSVTLSPAGDRLVTAFPDGKVRVSPLAGDGTDTAWLSDTAFPAAPSQVAGEQMQLWQVKMSGPPVAILARPGTGPIATSADGQVLAFADGEGKIQVPGRHPMVIDAQLNHVQAVGVADNGDVYVRTATGLSSWHTDPKLLHDTACRGGPISESQWQQYFPGLDYRSPC